MVETLPGAFQGETGNGFRFHDSSDVHVWSLDMDVPTYSFARFKEFLSNDELNRASRFRFDVHRNRFIVSHGWLREVLGNYLEAPAASLEFQAGPQGKPFLKGFVSDRGLQFNLTHSDSMAMLAVSPRARVGVDIERLRNLPDAEELVARFFSVREIGQFRALPDDKKSDAFFALWTRKEAWLKTTGEGITHLLSQVEVSFLEREPARLIRLPDGYADPSNWWLGSIVPAEGFIGAIVLEAAEARPLLRSWSCAPKEGLK